MLPVLLVIPIPGRMTCCEIEIAAVSEQPFAALTPVTIYVPGEVKLLVSVVTLFPPDHV